MFAAHSNGPGAVKIAIETERGLLVASRLLASREGDDLLRQRLARSVHAPALIDAEVSSVVRGLAITAAPRRISAVRAGQMLADYAGLRIVRHRIQPLQARVFELRHDPVAVRWRVLLAAREKEPIQEPTTTATRPYPATRSHDRCDRTARQAMPGDAQP